MAVYKKLVHPPGHRCGAHRRCLPDRLAVLMPKAEYLPQGNRNLILNILIPPPGYFWITNASQLGRFHLQGHPSLLSKKISKTASPRSRTIFYVSADRITLFGAISHHETRGARDDPAVYAHHPQHPGHLRRQYPGRYFSERDWDAARTVDVNVSGEDYRRHHRPWPGRCSGPFNQNMPQAQVRPVPSLENSYPEANFIPTETAPGSGQRLDRSRDSACTVDVHDGRP